MEDSLEFASHGSNNPHNSQSEDSPAQDLYQTLRQHHDFLVNLYIGSGKNHKEFQDTYNLLLKEDLTAQERAEVLRKYYEALQNHHAFIQDYLEALQDYYPLVLSLVQQESTDR